MRTLYRQAGERLEAVKRLVEAAMPLWHEIRRQAYAARRRAEGAPR